MSIGVVDKTGEVGAVQVQVVNTHRTMDSVVREYNIQGVVPFNAVSPKRKLCSVEFDATNLIASVTTPDVGSHDLLVEDGVPKLVFTPYILAGAASFPDSVRIAVFDKDTGLINSAPQYIGSGLAEKKWHESGENCYYEPVVIDNIFMSNKLQIKAIITPAPVGYVEVLIGAYVGGDAVYVGGGEP